MSPAQEFDDAKSSIFNFDDDELDHEEPESSTSSTSSFDKSSIAHLIATYGNSSATAWLEFERYRIWQAAPGSISQSSFSPIQGYMQRKKYVYAWGNPLVSHPSALAPTARAFVDWATKQGLKPIWCCADLALEKVLANDLAWAGVECIHEETLNPDHIVEMTGDSYRGHEGVGAVKDLKKNLRRAERAGVFVQETTGKWDDRERKQVEDGLAEWRKSKGAKGVQLASTTGQPWIDEAHRRYWVAKHEGQIVGILILTPVQGPDTTSAAVSTAQPESTPAPTHKSKFSFKFGSKRSTPTSSEAESSSDESLPSPTFSPQHSASSSSSSLHTSLNGCPLPHPNSNYYLIKNAISFPSAPRGTSEFLIHTCLTQLHNVSRPSRAPTVTFGITASDVLKPIDNLSGWKISSLSKVYGQVAKGAGLWKRGDFRAKFDSGREPMYVCYPQDGFGLDAIRGLLKVLRK
ncbi:aspartate-trna ligase [Moniliophthora roreri MCA 2997]|uniref:Aspartate-trna ligase n=2 Tax=Moniliophthora roreri TaxID=221103 RepID=V2WL31_MONRO|nr:aspartate-trna ligase [Moniliophthora roreri MCA 2997]KAI3621014.1 aspartate-trna ligase [Moniliophthora roreri]